MSELEEIGRIAGVDDDDIDPSQVVDMVGFKFSLKGLGHTLKKIASSSILKTAIGAGAQILSNPAVAKQLGIPPEAAAGIAAGSAALKLQTKAANGDPGAQKLVQSAIAASNDNKPSVNDDALWVMRIRVGK